MANAAKQIPTINIFPQNNDVIGLPKLDISTYNRFTTRLNELKVPNEFVYMAGANHYFSEPNNWQEVLAKLL